ncbi:MAG: redoxin domain-containing protein [Limnohabitans sp.]|nr:redoxin domain-containing protein [Limnohabitans sp.]
MHLVIKKILTIFFLLFVFSCNQNKKIDAIDTKQINLTDSLEIYNPTKISLTNKKQVLENPSHKVYTYLNVSCSSCLFELNEWSTIAQKFKELNTEVIFICYSKDKFQYFKYLYEDDQIKRLPFPFLLDSNDIFLRNNSMFKKYELGQVFLTDASGKIILNGNIIHSENLLNKYLTLIKRNK